MADAGLRPQEAVALTWGAVRERTILVERAVSNGELREFTKTGSRRAVEICGPLAEDLSELRSDEIDSSDFVLAAPRADMVSIGNWRNRV